MGQASEAGPGDVTGPGSAGGQAGRQADGRAGGQPAAQAPIGVVLVTHGALCDEFRLALEHVVGPQGGVASIAIAPDDDDERRRLDILDAVRSVDAGSGVAVLTDMFGGTPSNLAISIMDEGRIEVLAGVNLPMLVRLARVRATLPLAEAIEAAQEAGRKYISIASHVLAGR